MDGTSSTNNEIAKIESHLRKARALLRALHEERGRPNHESGPNHPWIADTINRSHEAPTPCELLVARYCLDPTRGLDDTADDIITDFCEGLTGKGSELTELLNMVLPEGSKRPKRLSYDFRHNQNKRRESFVCNDPKGLERYLSHHMSSLRPSTSSGEPRLLVVDVLSREGRIVHALLEHLMTSIENDEAERYECIVARVVIQARDPVFRESLESLARDEALLEELRSRHIYGWFRYIPDAPTCLRVGTVYGNWVSSIPYAVEELECANIRQRLWRGDLLDDVRTRDLYFGVHGVGTRCRDYYNHVHLDLRTSHSMRETQRQLANIHAHYWTQTCSPCRAPSVVDIR